MDVIVRSNNNPVNDINAPMSALINDLDKVFLVSDCNGLSKWIFMSPIRQTNPGRLFM